ncbi:3-methylitaconate isomerase [Fusobacterium simiae]|uniref:3-methylitaconate isomerase n=1 Tax=Fusobacterium simiae TaxID=855 RepID=A0ABT4DKT9_FUSSI|nr:3-methylitaconate isomerase [Fusobacterium simiae]
MKKYDFILMRGGTSKALFFKEEDMPNDKNLWTKFLLDAMGSPDERQIDGMGGANSLTSKVAIIKKSTREDADIDYTFAQVSLTSDVVDFKGNCGNISSAVAPYSIIKGTVKPKIENGRTIIKIFNTNTQKIIEAEIEIKDGTFYDRGQTKISGVPGTASSIILSFNNAEGAVTNKLLPTGNAKDKIITSKGEIEISIVDAANPLVFINAENIGLRGNELPQEFSEENLNYIEEIRSIAAELCDFCKKEEATKKSPAVPKATIISKPQSYTTINGTTLNEKDSDISIRMMSMQKPHKALAITGAICITYALFKEGTLVNLLVKPKKDMKKIRLAHPGGVMEVSPNFDGNYLKGVKVERTARMIAEGKLNLKEEY